MDMSNMLSIPDENRNLPPKLKEARDMFRYAAIFFLVAALLYGLWGLWSIMSGLIWSAWAWGAWRIMQGVLYLIFAGIALVLKSKFEESIIKPMDYGQSDTVKDNLIIYIILGFIFGMVLSGLLILLGYMKLGEADTHANMCPDCRSPMRYVQDYQRWYCDNCQDYKVPIHPASQTTPPPQGPPQQSQQGWQQGQQEQQGQQSQQGWQQEQQQQQPGTQPTQQSQQGWQQGQQEQETEEQNSCPTCGSQMRWINEYSRWYCDSCQEYK
ncbi:MAG: hypothetical protein R6W73_00015 [Candidatus Saliniplasma sp.]